MWWSYGFFMESIRYNLQVNIKNLENRLVDKQISSSDINKSVCGIAERALSQLADPKYSVSIKDLKNLHKFTQLTFPFVIKGDNPRAYKETVQILTKLFSQTCSLLQAFKDQRFDSYKTELLNLIHSGLSLSSDKVETMIKRAVYQKCCDGSGSNLRTELESLEDCVKILTTQKGYEDNNAFVVLNNAIEDFKLIYEQKLSDNVGIIIYILDDPGFQKNQVALENFITRHIEATVRGGYNYGVKMEFDLLKSAINKVSKMEKYIDNNDLKLMKNICEQKKSISSYEVKSGALILNEAPTIKLRSCLKSRLQSDLKVIQRGDPRLFLSRLRAERLYRLQNLELVYAQVSQDPHQRAVNKFFPVTHGWYVSALAANGSPIESEMIQIAKNYNISVITNAKNAHQGADNVLFFNTEHGDTFPQDYIDFSRDEIRFPVINPFCENETPEFIMDCETSPNAFEKPEFQAALYAGRVARGWETIETVKGIETDCPSRIHSLGASWANYYSLKATSLAQDLMVKPVMNLTYSEGGNTLSGMDGNIPYLIIGEDTKSVSKYIIEQDLGREVSEEELRMAFAIDHGVSIENLYFVEQPGDFHLDMSMAIMGGKKVILNDAGLSLKKCQSLQRAATLDYFTNYMSNNLGMLEDADFNRNIQVELPQEIEKRAYLDKYFEDKTEGDLKRQGFQVIRIPGRFYIARNDSFRYPIIDMNYFNMVTATTPDGHYIIVANGCENKEFENDFKNIINENCEKKVDFFHFLDYQSCQISLAIGGGVSCRTKSIT